MTSLALLAYLAVSLWTLRGVLPDPSSLLLMPDFTSPAIRTISELDQSMVLWVVTRNATVLQSDPLQLFGYSQCYPLAGAHVLGEHMVGAGLLASVPLRLSDEPIFAYNAMLLLTMWIAGASMFLFVREIVGRPGPAFLAGLLFLLTPERTFDTIHPFVHGDHWAPLVALFLHRWMDRGRARDLLGLGITSALVMLESLYALLATTVFLVAYAVHLLWAYRRSVGARLPGLLLVALALLALAKMLFEPYLNARDEFGVLQGRVTLPIGPQPLLIESSTVLAAIALVDRVWRGRWRARRDDPRFALLVASMAARSMSGVPLVLGGFVVLPSTLGMLYGLLPGLDAVRAPYLVAQAAWLCCAVLASYGVAALGDLVRRPALRTALTAAIAAYVVAERCVPAIRNRVLIVRPEFRAWHARPRDEDVRLLRATSGPIIDLPVPSNTVAGMGTADYLRLESWAPRPTSACYNSFSSPLAEPIAQLANQLPDPRAADALHALGFRTVLVHPEKFWPPYLNRFRRELAGPAARDRVQWIGGTAAIEAFRLVSRAPAAADWQLVAQPDEGATASETPVHVPVGTCQAIEIPVRNGGARTFRQPPPIRPREFVARWYDETGAATEQRARTVFPLALAAGARSSVVAELDVPPTPGDYRVTLAPAEAPELAVGVARVRVDTAAAPSAGAACVKAAKDP